MKLLDGFDGSKTYIGIAAWILCKLVERFTDTVIDPTIWVAVNGLIGFGVAHKLAKLAK